MIMYFSPSAKMFMLLPLGHNSSYSPMFAFFTFAKWCHKILFKSLRRANVGESKIYEIISTICAPRDKHA